MKRSELILKLVNEGMSHKTLVNFTDKQLNDLSERMLGEQQTSQTQGKGMLNVKDGSPDEAAAKQAGKSFVTYENDVTENLIGKQKNIDKNHNGKIDAQDFKILKGQKKEKEPKEGNEFSKKVVDAKKNHKDSFELNGKKYPVKEGEKKDVNELTLMLKVDKKKKEEEEKKKDEKKKEEKKCEHCGKNMKDCKCDDSHLGESKSYKKWIQKATDPKKKGQLHKDLGVPQDEKIPASKLKSAAKKGGKVGQRARFAMNLSKLNESELKTWIENLLEEENSSIFTSKSEIMELIKIKLHEQRPEPEIMEPDIDIDTDPDIEVEPEIDEPIETPYEDPYDDPWKTPSEEPDSEPKMRHHDEYDSSDLPDFMKYDNIMALQESKKFNRNGKK